VRAIVLCLCLAATQGAVTSEARAQTEDVAAVASRHFQRGVDLYGEGDFRGALVEFKRAYALLPRAPVLYDIGQTEFQLQEYAQALQTLERFLAETGPNAAHHAEVKDTVETLRGRVGRIDLSVDRAACDVTVDDQPSGSTPLAQPLLVSVGRRRVAVSCAGQPPGVRNVDVAAGQTVPVEIAAALLSVGPVEATLAVAPRSRISHRVVVAAWTLTATLAAASAGFYTAAVVESRELDRLRSSYPVAPDRFSDRLSLTSRLALTADILAVVTLVAVGTSTYLSLGARAERRVQVGLTANGLIAHGSF
jgi:tetratricopeptide (TPR) repeat protein